MLIRSLILLYIQLTQHMSNANVKWLNHLSNYIVSDAQVNQVIFLIACDPEITNSRFEDDIYALAIKFPTRIIKFQTDDALHIPELKIGDPRTSLFILIHSRVQDPNLSLLQEPINFLSNLSPSRSRPKCLIILFEKVNQNHEKLLRHMWAYDFLDTTVLTLSSSLDGKNDLFLNQHQQIVSIHYFNPHTNSMKKENLTSIIQWFPDKVQDLHGYPLKVSFSHVPPYVIVQSGTKGEVIISGLGWLKMNVIAKSMNFKMISIVYKTWGTRNCRNKFNSSGVYGSMINREAGIFSIEFGRFASCDETFYEWGKATMDSEICLLVPIFTIESHFLTASWKILNLFAVISLPLIVWMFARLADFNAHYWHWTYLFQIVLGFTAPREPKKLAERILFGFVLITCFSYSTVIFTAFTNIGIEHKTSYKLETIEDVISSDLQTEMNSNLMDLLNHDNNDVILKLLRKAVKVENLPHLCIQKLITHKNVICVARPEEIEFFLRRKRDRCGSPIAKMLRNDEVLSRTVRGTVLTARSPYVKRVDTIIQRLIEAGITEEWRSMSSDKSGNTASTEFSCIEKGKESSQRMKQILLVLIFGYTLSILIFFREISSVWKLKEKARNFRITYLLADR